MANGDRTRHLTLPAGGKGFSVLVFSHGEVRALHAIALAGLASNDVALLAVGGNPHGAQAIVDCGRRAVDLLHAARQDVQESASR
jgi:hypothetical protein